MLQRAAVLPQRCSPACEIRLRCTLMNIRDEQTTDADAVAHVVEQAFGRPDEALLVGRLRKEGDAVVSLVAETDAGVIGHVLLSRMEAPFRALALAPLSVLPQHERRGVGAELTRAAGDRARAEGWDAVFVLGDPRYYGRFGFRADLAAGFTSLYAGPHLMVLPLKGELPKRNGPIDYAEAFAELD
jgi:putative acetyltransferase